LIAITFVISQLTEFCKFPRLLTLCIETSSPVKSIVFIRFDVGKSFTHKNKNNEPKIESCGTLAKIDFIDYFVSPPWTLFSVGKLRLY